MEKLYKMLQNVVYNHNNFATIISTYMPIVFSEHAIFQLKKRRISRKRILDVVKDPEEIIPSYKNRRLRRKLFGDKILQAVTVTEGSRITIVSGYYLRK